jgi:hypothetical protein
MGHGRPFTLPSSHCPNPRAGVSHESMLPSSFLGQKQAPLQDFLPGCCIDWWLGFAEKLSSCNLSCGGQGRWIGCLGL